MKAHTQTSTATVPPVQEPEEVVGYYNKPMVKAHPWKDYIGWYFFTGGLAGASSVIAAVADVTGRPTLAKHARRASLIGLLPSPALLIADLGRPKRFGYMLRVLKPTSPMSVGSWLLSAYGACATGAAGLGELHLMPGLRRALSVAAGVTGSGVATYTAVLVADTATPAWHEARRELPFLFAASAGASGGAATLALSALAGKADPTAARVGVVGAVCEVVTAKVMQRRLGELDTYRTDPRAQRLDRAAQVLSLGGAAAMSVSRRSRSASIAAAAAVAAGSLCQRLAVLRAGVASANDPRSVLVSQKANR